MGKQAVRTCCTLPVQHFIASTGSEKWEWK